MFYQIIELKNILQCICACEEYNMKITHSIHTLNAYVTVEIVSVYNRPFLHARILLLSDIRIFSF